MQPRQAPKGQSEERCESELGHAGRAGKPAKGWRQNKATESAKRPHDATGRADVIRKVIRNVLEDRRFANSHRAAEPEQKRREGVQPWLVHGSAGN